MTPSIHQRNDKSKLQTQRSELPTNYSSSQTERRLYGMTQTQTSLNKLPQDPTKEKMMVQLTCHLTLHTCILKKKSSKLAHESQKPTTYLGTLISGCNMRRELVALSDLYTIQTSSMEQILVGKKLNEHLIILKYQYIHF